MVRPWSCSFKNVPSLCASRFSASAAALSGREASNAASSVPVSSSSSHAVHFSSNVFIEIPQQVLQFFPRVEKSRHDRANGTPERLRNLVILHVLGFLHQN